MDHYPDILVGYVRVPYLDLLCDTRHERKSTNLKLKAEL
jgi:hypothetical protein